MTEKNMTLKNGDVKSLLFRYSIPAIVSMLVSALYNVVDRIYIGNMPNVGSLAITGVGVTLPLTNIILAFSMLIGIGATANISIKLGEGKREAAEKIVSQTVTLSTVLGIAITIVGTIFIGTILKKFGASESTFKYAKDYIDIILFGTVFNIMGYSLNSVIRADGNPKICSAIMVLSCAVNIILDPIFIFVLELGIKGAAYATVISQIVTLFLSYIYFKSSRSDLKIKKEYLFLNKESIKMILAVGISPFVMQLATSTVQVINNSVLKTYGGDFAIGAMTTINAVAILCFMPVFGISQGAQPIIGYNYGAKQFDRMREVLKISMIVGTVIFLVMLFFIEIFPLAIIKIFNNDSTVIDMSVKGIRIYLMAMPAIGLGMVGSNYFLAIGQGKIAMFLSLLRQVILLIPLIIIFSKKFGLVGIWLAQPVADAISSIVSIVALKINLSKKEKL